MLTAIDSPTTVRFGVDVMCDSRTRPAWRRVGLVTNDAARRASASDEPTRLALRTAGIPLVRLFGPEHGLGASATDGAAVPDGRDALTGLPIVSLYGDRLRPETAQLADLDAVLFDVPDVGARFYTYAWTLWHLLHAAADHGTPVVVLDRPNPLGGVVEGAEGPLMDLACRSFIGEDDIPVRHGLTLGELARLWQREHLPGVALEVVACEGWDRGTAWPATGLPWVPTSPAMPTFASAVWYPGTCLFEATNVSVARGTAAPFATIGAPWLAAEALARAFRAAYGDRHGVEIVSCRFIPETGPHAGNGCAGVRLAWHDDHDASFIARTLRPVQVGLTLLGLIADLHPHAFAWATYPTAANPRGEAHFARLVGRADIADELRVLTGEARATAIETWTRAPGWDARVQDVLLY